MQRLKTNYRRILVGLFIASTYGPTPVVPVQAQKRAIVVNAEQPNVWTLEQAHYLLAQMHRRNLDLKATGLGELDPNEINGLNFDVLRTLLEFGVEFDDAARFNNSLLKTRKTFDADRAIKLQKRRDELADESLNLNRDIARLGREKALADEKAEKDKLAAQIDELKAVKEGVDTEVTRLDADIKAAGGPSGDVQNTEAEASFDASKLPKSIFDDSAKDIFKKLIDRFNEAPKLNATIRLDNFLQMQYEIIAKQLTLLRDEVGPGERIIFLEMPQTVNASYDKSNKMWAQSWWKIDGYTTPRLKPPNDRTRSNNRQDARGPQYAIDQTGVAMGRASLFAANDLKDVKALATILRTAEDPVMTYIRSRLSSATGALLRSYSGAEVTADLQEAILKELNAELLDTDLFARLNAASVRLAPDIAAEGAANPRGWELIALNRLLLEIIFPTAIWPKPVMDNEPLTMNRVVQDAVAAYGMNGAGPPNRVRYVSLDSTSDLENRSVRTVELIPRQSSLNINDIKLRARAGALTAIAKTLFGFGARLNFQRQRETFSQFVQQELYSSGFGKGAREFGWTFNPMPGTDRVLSGTRTTYAVLVVPTEAEALVMHTTGCYFPRSDYQPLSFEDAVKTGSRWTNRDNENRQCSESKAFAVAIPGGGETDNYDFWVDGLEYVPAEKSDQVVLTVYGRNFPTQLGMLVDGVPLTQSIGVAQPLIRDDSSAFVAAHEELKNAKVTGSIERIDANQLVAVFDRPNGKDGTQPTITLTAPGKAKILNRLKLYINGVHDKTLNDNDVALLFGRRAADKDPFRIDNVQLFKYGSALTALVHGEGFLCSGASVLKAVIVNGTQIRPANYEVLSPSLLRVLFSTPADETIRVTLTSDDPKPGDSPNPDPTTIESDPVPNPGLLNIIDVSIISYEEGNDKEPGTLVVKIEGAGFTKDLKAYVDEKSVELAVKSATEAFLKITDPKAAAVLVLKDTQTGFEAKTIITRKAPK